MAAAPIVNASFETGDFTGWVVESDNTVTYAVVDNSSVSGDRRTPYGSKFVSFASGTPGVFRIVQEDFTPVYVGKSITASLNYSQGPEGANLNTGRVILRWYDADENYLSESPGTLIFATGGSGFNQGAGFVASSVTASAPDNAAFVKIGLWSNRDRNGWTSVDNFVWNYELPDVTLTYPINLSTYAGGTEVPFRVEIGLEGATVESVSYVATNTATTDETIIGPVTTAPWGTNFAGLAEGNYSAIARVTFVGGLVVDSLPKTFTVGPVPAPDTREFKASNSYTNLVSKNFVGLASAIPPTAQVVGMQTVIDYYIQALVRSKDIGVEDLTVARYDAAFEMVPTVTFETVLLDDNGTTYTSMGGSATAQQDVLRSDYSVVEDGTSEGKRWTVLEGDPQSVTVGQTNDLFGMDFMTAAEFVTKALGVRFYPNLAAKPDYADTGDACFRVNLDKLRVQIYFDAGSVEYYFVSPDGTQVIKGRLAAAYVDSGAFANGDAAGVMQLASDLEVVDGDSRTIEEDWTIHSAYPPTDANQIGVVDEDMSYNGLAPYWDVEDNRSRYQFISANFYGDLTYDSIYGVNGVERAFSYNGDYFYKIHTQADLAKDKPRHVEFYHTHLALGYNEGRVDVSVVGEPYNFNGVDGASSWAIGDSVTGLLNLSGTMLGIFCRKSIHGLAGTTVDNFATQVLSPKNGAVEYTVTDMGFPVYANAYGIYTLAQTEKYGEYLGTPMSQDVSPWLRKRLVRKSTSPREVVVAWPVRAKNQYRLAFKDGYVLTMTMNNGLQEAPTFSKQKYFTENNGPSPGGDFVDLQDSDVNWSFSDLAGMPNTSAVQESYVVSVGDGSGELPYGGAWRLEFEEDVQVEVIVYGNAYAGFNWEGGSIPPTMDGQEGLEFTTDVTNYVEYSMSADPNTSYEIEQYAMLIRVRRPGGGEPEVIGLYEYPSMVPAAISSELDDGGEERIHIANKQGEVITPPVPPANCVTAQLYAEWGGAGNNSSFYVYYDPESGGPVGMQDAPQWLIDAAGNGEQIQVDFYNDGYLRVYNHVSGNFYTLADFASDVIYADGSPSQRGTIYSSDMSQSVCMDWIIPGGV